MARRGAARCYDSTGTCKACSRCVLNIGLLRGAYSGQAGNGAASWWLACMLGASCCASGGGREPAVAELACLDVRQDTRQATAWCRTFRQVVDANGEGGEHPQL